MSFLFASSVALLFSQQGITEPVKRADYLATWDLQFQQLDADGDGKVTGQEITAKLTRDVQQQALQANQQIFARLDKDNNGALTAEEFAGLMAQAPQADPAATLERLDMNRDGVITLVENRTVMLAAFDALDVDKDGIVTPQEMTAASQPQPAASR